LSGWRRGDAREKQFRRGQGQSRSSVHPYSSHLLWEQGDVGLVTVQGQALIASITALDTRKDIAPLARREFVCWVEEVKQKRPEIAASARPWKSTGPRP
jgi:hypothetical protein